MPRSFTKIISGALLSLLGVLFLNTESSADKIADYNFIMQMEYMSHQGKIDFVSPKRDFILASGKKIFLVDARHGTELFLTAFKNIDGESASLNDLEVGTWIYVWGGVMKGGNIGAKEIVIIPRSLSEQEMKRYPSLQSREIWGGIRKRYD